MIYFYAALLGFLKKKLAQKLAGKMAGKALGGGGGEQEEDPNEPLDIKRLGPPEMLFGMTNPNMVNSNMGMSEQDRIFLAKGRQNLGEMEDINTGFRENKTIEDYFRSLNPLNRFLK